MKAASGIAFSALDQNSRVGFHTLWENSTLFTNVKDFTAANKQAWLTNVYKVTPNGGTPLPDAMWRVGELFAGNLAGSTLPGATDPLDPVTGKVPAQLPPVVDRRLLELDALLRVARQRRPDGALARESARVRRGSRPDRSFPRPYYEGPTATSNSLADLAMYYWIRDLRPADCGQGEGLHRAVAARQRLWPVDRRPRHDQLPERHQRHHIRHGQLAARDGSRRTGSHRRPVARGRQQPRQVLQREQRAAAGGEHRQRAGRLHRPVRHGHGRGHRRRPVERDQPVCVQDELRSGHLGRRQEVRDRHRHRRASHRRQRQPGQRSAVVGRDAARCAGGRERGDQRLGHAAPHRDDQRRDRCWRFRSASRTSPPRSRRRSRPDGASWLRPRPRNRC